MKVGDYVRTEEGNIYKIAKLGYNNETFWSDTDDGWFAMYKSSPNIIDLIEVGDYVNGSYVEGFIEKNKFQNKLIITEAGMIDNNDIKSIVTKKQFESMEYKVKE